MIPLNIFQIWHAEKLPPKMKENINLLIKQNPEFKYYLFDIKKSRNFIKNHFNKEVLDTYDNLIPIAYKADLWRYCILYIKGGIYLDVKYKPINNFKFKYLIDKEYFCEERYKTNMIYNAIIITNKHNKIMKKCIDEIVKNVKENYYGLNALCPTGPQLLGKFVYDENNNYKSDLKFSNDGIHIIFKNDKILNMYDEYRSEQLLYKPKNTKYYGEMWVDGKIYNNHKRITNPIFNWYRKNMNIIYYQVIEKIIKNIC